MVDKKGQASFQRLQNYLTTQKGTLVYYIFDLLYLDGYDLRNTPLRLRKELLKKLLPKSNWLKFSDHVERIGKKFFTALKKKHIEGMVGKNADSTYQSGVRSADWLKIKTVMRQEAVICGYTAARGGRHYFGALILGVYERGKLTYIGHTGTGFDEKTLSQLHARLQKITRKKSPFLTEPKTNMPVTWVLPKLVCEIKFSEWTTDGSMRQPVFLGLREDKPSTEVTRELPHRTKI